MSQKSEWGNEEKLDEKDKHQTLLDFRRCLVSNMEEKQPGYDWAHNRWDAFSYIIVPPGPVSLSAHIRVTRWSQIKAGRSEFDSVWAQNEQTVCAVCAQQEKSQAPPLYSRHFFHVRSRSVSKHSQWDRIFISFKLRPPKCPLDLLFTTQRTHFLFR